MATRSNAAMMVTTLAVFALGLASVAGTQACTLASPTHITVQEGEDTSDGGAGASSSSSSSSSSGGPAAAGGAAVCSTTDFIVPDLAKLTACGEDKGAKGHCYPKNKTPMSDQLIPCANASDVCVPDEFLLANGQPLKACTSIVGPGGCAQIKLIPEAEKRGGSALKPDVCEGGAVCMPCKDPTNGGAATPFCLPIGAHEKECAAGAAPGGADGGGAAKSELPGCCTTNGKSNGVCLASKDLPPAQVDQAPQDTCAETDKCAPRSMVEGNVVKCPGGLLGEGVCMDKCFNSLMSLAGAVLNNEGCGATEICAPCRFLKDKGVPGCS